ncbi:MAG: hypothetical protein WCA24_01580 [Thiomonas sp.]
MSRQNLTALGAYAWHEGSGAWMFERPEIANPAAGIEVETDQVSLPYSVL